jgi:O-antigen ligase
MNKLEATRHKADVGDVGVFVGLLALLIWAPLPLGSNRVWAVGLLLIAAVLLLLGTVFAWRKQVAGAQARLYLFRWPLGLLAGMVLLAWLQTVALPAAWVHALSPNAAAVQMPSEWMTLSVDVFQSRIMAALCFVYWVVFLVTVLAVRDGPRLERLALVFVWSGVLQAVLGAVLFSIKAEYTIFFSSVSHGRLIGSFVNPNHMAGYLCMCLSVGIGLMLARLGHETAPRRGWKARVLATLAFVLSDKMRLRLLLVVLVIALVLTLSRMGNTAFFAAMLVVGLVAVVLARKTAPQTVALIASLVIIDIFVVGTWVGLEKLVERIQETEVSASAGGKSESIEVRTQAARDALPIVRDFPVFGTGGGSFYNVFLSYRPPEYGYTYVDHTHNDYVEIAADFGLLGVGILGTLVALTLGTVVLVMARRRSSLPRGIAFGVAMSIVALLIHSTVDFNLQIPANALTMVVVLAMGWLSHTLIVRRSSRSAANAQEDEE